MADTDAVVEEVVVIMGVTLARTSDPNDDLQLPYCSAVTRQLHNAPTSAWQGHLGAQVLSRRG